MGTLMSWVPLWVTGSILLEISWMTVWNIFKNYQLKGGEYGVFSTERLPVKSLALLGNSAQGLGTVSASGECPQWRSWKSQVLEIGNCYQAWESVVTAFNIWCSLLIYFISRFLPLAVRIMKADTGSWVLLPQISPPSSLCYKVKHIFYNLQTYEKKKE